MPIFGGGKKPKKPSRKKRLQGAFSIQVSPTARDKAAMAREAAKDAAIRTLAREKKKEAERIAAVEKADALKEAALKLRRLREEEAQAREDAAAAREARAAQRSACTCRRPAIGSDGKCVRCRKKPAFGGRRRR